MYVSNGSITPNVTSAGVFVKVTGFTAETSPASLNCTVAGDSIKVTNAGNYRISVSVNNITGTLNDVFRFAVAINGTTNTKYQGEANLSITSLSGNVSFTGRYTMPANAGASLRVTNTAGTTDPTFTQVSFVLTRE